MAPQRRAARKDCHERALGLLAARARSHRELQERLARAGFEPEEVSAELERLAAVGLVDDEAFARQLADRAFSSNKSRRAVAGALAAKGVARETAAAVMGNAADDEQGRADDLAAAKAARMRSVDPERAARRLYGLLARRGYSSDVARSAVRSALAVEAPDDEQT